MNKTVICPGSFDPVTYGHLDVIRRASKMFDHVIVAVLVNSSKSPCFSIDERMEFLREVTQDIENVEVASFEGLLAEYCKERNVDAIVKGLRAVSDFEYEFQQALTNKILNPDLETMFMMTNQKYMYLSSTIVRQIAAFDGDISEFVLPEIKDDILERIKPIK